MGPVSDDLTAVMFEVVVEYRNGDGARPVKPMPFELSSTAGEVLRYVDTANKKAYATRRGMQLTS
jgi:hypothetical protein